MLKRIFVLLVTALLVSCQSILPLPGQDPSELRGSILVWHSWEDAEAEVLNDLLDKFTDIHPKVTIIRGKLGKDEIIDEFHRLSVSGFGPDILIASADLTRDLAQEDLIQELTGFIIDPENKDELAQLDDYKIDTDIYLATSMDMLRDHGELYGLPLSLNTPVLFYNKKLLYDITMANQQATVVEMASVEETPTLAVEAPADEGIVEALQAPTEVPTVAPTATPKPQIEIKPAGTLQELWEHANQGHRLALPISFRGGFWGVQAFGGVLFDEEGRVVLNQGGFANWLGWLKRLQDVPTVIFDSDQAVLTEQFTEGIATYYIGNSGELSSLQAILGEDVVGCVRLPARQGKPAGPFLEAQVMMFNKASAPKDTELALRLARYLTNVEQQRELALETGQLPVHKRVSIDPRISLVVSEMIAQSRTAVPVTLDNVPKLRALEVAGDELYHQVLAGEIGGGGAASLLTEQVNTQYGFEALPSSEVVSCEGKSNIQVWHSLPEQVRPVLSDIKDNFLNLCPNSTIVLTAMDPHEIYDRYREAVLEKKGPDLIIGSNLMLPVLAKDSLIRDIDNLVESEFLQRYLTQLEQSMMYDGKLHGLPISMDMMALYYKTNLVKDPPVILDDFLTIASAETPIALPAGFYEAYWGIASFGETTDSPIFDEEKRLIIGDVGLVDWLTWLSTAQEQTGVIVSADREKLKTMFIEGEAALLVDESKSLSELQSAIGEELGVVPLPGGPMLVVNGMMFNPHSSEEKVTLALQFAQYVTGAESQTMLMEKANRVPANVNVNYTSYPAIAGFIEQASTSAVIPNVSEMGTVWQWGQTVYDQVLINKIDPANAVKEFTNLIDTVNGFDVTDEETLAEFADCTEEGQILLWHSWTEKETTAWQIVIDKFHELCPSIELQLKNVPADNITEQLESLNSAKPDLFLARHNSINPLREAELLKDITSLVDKDSLVNYTPEAISAVRYQEQLYGIPQTLNTQALYYNKDMVETPVSNLDELLKVASPKKQVGLNPNFKESFWGAATLGCAPCQSGQLFDEVGTSTLATGSDFAAWSSWLKIAGGQEGMVFNTDQQQLQTMFANGELAYVVADSSALNSFQEILGKAKVGVTTLPTGPTSEEGMASKARPFLEVDTFLFNNGINEIQLSLALKFAKFANLQKNQTLLLQEGNFIPTNKLATAINSDAAIGSFINQVATTIILPDAQKMELLETASGMAK